MFLLPISAGTDRRLDRVGRCEPKSRKERLSFWMRLSIVTRADYWMVISSPFVNDRSRLRGKPATVLPAGTAELTEVSK